MKLEVQSAFNAFYVQTTVAMSSPLPGQIADKNLEYMKNWTTLSGRWQEDG